MIQLYDTLSRSIRPFIPLTKDHVKMYTCGLTVYSQPQIGNWVAYIYSDILTRLLMSEGYHVERVQNITDVGHLVSDDDTGEDKMEKGARKEGKTAWQIAEKYISIADHEAYTLLGLLRPTKLVRATDLIQEQIAFVQALEAKGFTYQIADGVYFDTSKLDNYGELARLDIAGLQGGARVEVGGKRNITDFALWKLSPSDSQRDMEWESPWGVGFPGWHLECSVIAMQGLGDQIDIHTGGIDHIPVHHTNEIAQTESLTHKQFAQFWFHNNHIKVNGSKLSKSLGNSYTLEDIIQHGYELNAFKLMVLSSHYRTEGNFTWEIVESSQNRLNDMNAWADLRHQGFESKQYAELCKSSIASIKQELANDLNTPEALATLSNLVKQTETLNPDSKAILRTTKEIDALLGLGLDARKNVSEDIQHLIDDRKAARVNKDWQQSDELRNDLMSKGIAVRDASYGQVWSRAAQK